MQTETLCLKEMILFQSALWAPLHLEVLPFYRVQIIYMHKSVYSPPAIKTMADDETSEREGEKEKEQCALCITCWFFHCASPLHRRSIETHDSFVGLILSGYPNQSEGLT